MTSETIEPRIANYVDASVDKAIDRAVKKYSRESDIRITTYITAYMAELNTENKRHMEALKEAFHSDMLTLAELIQDRPTRSEAREIAREEIDEALRPVNTKLDFLNEERKEIIEKLEEIKA